MKVLFLCGYFATVNENEILKNTKTIVEYSANNFQKKLISGLQKTIDNISVISAPFIGSFPNVYSQRKFTGFSEITDECVYVKFNNIWGIRNFSRTKALKVAIKEFIDSDDQDKRIVVYSPHTPFLAAAVFAKRKDPKIKICLIVPDLPQYMNLGKKSLLYRIGKMFDICTFNRLNTKVDSYMLLTEYMKEKINIDNKPYIVVEGIVDNQNLPANVDVTSERDSSIKNIVYAGKISFKFNVDNLVKAFQAIEDKNCNLILCGNGDAIEYAKTAANIDTRIKVLGQVSSDSAKNWINNADVLVNPRLNVGEYTKYSFPSKNIEYLFTGIPVVAYMLDGMKPNYRDYLIVPKDDSIGALKDAICAALTEKYSNESFIEYSKHLNAEEVCKSIMKLF